MSDKTNERLLRNLFGEQREYFKAMNIEPYGSFSPDSRYFTATSSNGWRKYLTQLIGADDRHKQLQRINQVVTRRLCLMAKKIPPAVTQVTLGEGTVSAVPVEIESPATMDIRIGNKIYSVTEVKEDNRNTALLDKAIGSVQDEALSRVKELENEFKYNISSVSRQYDTEIAKLKVQVRDTIPAASLGRDALRNGLIVDVWNREYRIYVPISLHYKYVTMNEGKEIWKLYKKYQVRVDGYLMVATDRELRVKHTYIFDRQFNSRLPLFHVSGSSLCLGTYEPKMTCFSDAFRIRDELAKVLEKINLDSLGMENIDLYEDAKEIHRAIREYLAEWEDYYDGETEDEPTLSIGTREGDKVWST